MTQRDDRACDPPLSDPASAAEQLRGELEYLLDLIDRRRDDPAITFEIQENLRRVLRWELLRRRSAGLASPEASYDKR